MRFNIMRNIPSIFALSALFLLASGLVDVELTRVFGNASGALYAAGRSHSARRAKAAKTDKAKTASKANVPQEWQWFSEPIHFNAVSFTNETKETAEMNQASKPNASFQLALAKMQKIRSQRTERDKELLAKIKADEKSVSMAKMNKKVKEMTRRADRLAGRSGEPMVIEAPVVAPSFVPVPSSIKAEAPKIENNKGYQKNNKRLSRAERRKAREEAKKQSAAKKAQAIQEAKKMAEAKAQEAVSNVQETVNEAVSYSAETTKRPILMDREVSAFAPAMTSDELNEMIAIDDLVAVDNEPPAIVPVGETVSSAVSSKAVEGYNRYAPKAVEKVETLYKGIGSEYSERINEIVNERKDKLFQGR